MKRFTFFIAAYTLSCIPAMYAQDIFEGYENLFTPARQYINCQATGDIRIDGKLTETSWTNTLWSSYFTDIEGSIQPAPAFKTRVKLLWDTQNLYIAAELEEPAIWANIKEQDSVIFYDNDFEIFIDPDGDSHNYFEIEVNAFNTIFDLFLTKPYRDGGTVVTNWDVQNLRSAVSIVGTINNPEDIDKKWVVEMAIPFHSLSLDNKVQVPESGTTWRINFSRVEWETEIVNGVYVKRTDTATHRSKAEHNWVWSPQGVVNMHLPERWGYLHFSDLKAGAATGDLPLPPSEQIKKYLWLLYYKQQAYRRQHKQYATELSRINFPSVIEVAGLNCSISLEATGSQFKAVASSVPADEKWQISHEGKINKISIP